MEEIKNQPRFGMTKEERKKIESVTDKGNHADDVIQTDIKSHPQKRDFRHSVTHTRHQNIK